MSAKLYYLQEFIIYLKEISYIANFYIGAAPAPLFGKRQLRYKCESFNFLFERELLSGLNDYYTRRKTHHEKD